MKLFYSKNHSTIKCSPSMYFPLLTTRYSISFFHWSKPYWKFSFVRTFRSSTNFRFTSSIDSNQIPFKADSLGKGKSHSVLNLAIMTRIRALECLFPCEENVGKLWKKSCEVKLSEGILIKCWPENRKKSLNIRKKCK